MYSFLLLFAGFISGIFAGMGMGGGTFLIPILTLFLSIPQKSAQLINLMVFIPLAIISIIIFGKKKLIKPQYLLTVSVPACIVAIFGVIFSIKLPEKYIKICFGVFLILIALIQIFIIVIKFFRTRKMQKNKN